jgi:serine protease Do
MDRTSIKVRTRVAKRRLQPWAAVVLGLSLLLSVPTIAQSGVYKYRRSDGTWVFTDNLNDLPPEVRAQQADKTFEGSASPTRDLASRLTAGQNPRNPIEAAVLATVAVKSSVGMGSGFFLTEDGYILTNRHVIRTSEQAKAERTARSEYVDAQVQTVSARIEAEQQRLDAAMAELEANRRRMRSADYTLNRHSLEQWQQDLDQRRAKLEDQHDAFRRSQAEAEARDRFSDLDRVFTVFLADNTELRAYLVAVDESWDLALLKIDGYRVPRLAAVSGELAVGETVYAVGNPAALRNSVSRGVVSGYERGWIKTDAKIYPGNSGGPLIAASGRVLGVNTFKRLTERFEGLGFAVPIQRARRIFARHLPPETP